MGTLRRDRLRLQFTFDAADPKQAATYKYWKALKNRTELLCNLSDGVDYSKIIDALAPVIKEAVSAAVNKAVAESGGVLKVAEPTPARQAPPKPAEAPAPAPSARQPVAQAIPVEGSKSDMPSLEDDIMMFALDGLKAFNIV